MPNYIFVYHQPAGYVPARDSETMAAWEGFFGQIGDRVVEPGQPVFTRRAVGTVGDTTQLGGFSVVTADTLDDAVALAAGCPTLNHGGGVSVGELAELPPDHAASRIRDRLARA